MSAFAKLKIAHKLPAIVIGGVVAVGLGLGLAGVIIGSNVIAHAETDKLATLADGRATEMKSYLEAIEADLTLTANNPYTLEALKAFDSAWTELGDNPTKTLQDAYIEKNPNPLGSKHLLDAAQTGTAYDEVHGTYHATFREQLDKRGYYDIFLFDEQGDLVYTVFKELDYATNFKTGGGEWADTDLGNAFRAGIGLNKGETYFLDFKPYKPSYDAPASFISTPIFDGKKRVGVLVFQMPIDRINAIMGAKVGLGATGETLVVGEDRLLRNDSSFSEENDILQAEFAAQEVEAVINGNKAKGEFSAYRDTAMLFAAAPMEFKNTVWAVLAVQEKSGVYGFNG
jgi:methyl-accepting chemotaxis protein